MMGFCIDMMSTIVSEDFAGTAFEERVRKVKKRASMHIMRSLWPLLGNNTLCSETYSLSKVSLSPDKSNCGDSKCCPLSL